METIELQPKPFRLTIQIFLVVFVMVFITKLCVCWSYPDFEIWLFLRARVIEALVATTTFCIVMAIPFFRGCFNIRLTETTIQAPVKKRRFGFVESSTIDLTEISVNRSLRDRLIGTQVVTTEGEPLQIHSFFYDRKSITKLLDDIECRQKTYKT